MRWFILLAFIGVLLIKSASSLKNHGYPSGLEWMFGLNNKQNKNEKGKQNKPTVCQSQECKKIARIISESMDKSVNPCDDFYEYACGKWQQHNPAPKGIDPWNMYINFQTYITKQIKEILEEGAKKNDLLAVTLAKKWYASCINTNAIEKQGLEPLVSTLSRIGGWPLIMEPNEWNEQKYSWQTVDDYYMGLIGRNAFHDVHVYDFVMSNVTYNLVHLDTPYVTSDSSKFKDEANVGEEGESHRNPSDTENLDDEIDSQETESEVKDDNNNSNDDNENDENNDNNDTIEHDDDKSAKKEVARKRTAKFAKSKKLKRSRKMKNITHDKKYNNRKTKKEKLKRAIPMHVREKLRERKNAKNHEKRTRERLNKTVGAIKPQDRTQKTKDEDDEINEYDDYISKVARAIVKAKGVKIPKNMDKDIQDMIEFGKKLRDISTGSSKREILSIDEFQEWYDKKKPKTAKSKIDWLNKIGKLFDDAQVPKDDDLDIVIEAPYYFEALIALLDLNFIHWNFLRRIIQSTTSEMRKLYNAWMEKKGNDDDEIFGVRRRSFQCAEEIETSNIIAYEYVQKHFSNEFITNALDMIDDIQKEIENNIKKSNWMNGDTKDFLLDKLVNIYKFIGYPDWYKNNTIVKQYFQGLIIGNSYYENVLNYEKYSKWKNLRNLVNNVDSIVNVNPTSIQASFTKHNNAIIVSAAYFQSPMFANDRPQAINYGIVGSVISHEINHGFDNEGHLYDKNGNRVEWLPAMAEAYDKRAKCFVEQFNKYSLDKASKHKIENYGSQTLKENIADTLGLETAFKAYRRRQEKYKKPDTVLPGHEELTNDQLFFVSFANSWCGIVESKRALKIAKMDVHSVGRLRVIGSVSNSQDFAKAYNCPVDSAMNPKKKCHIWT